MRTETIMAPTFDTIVIGAGVNGLVAAATLAKAGQRVLVAEQRALAGGTAASNEFAPGFRADLLHDVGAIQALIAQELEFSGLGLHEVRADPLVVTPDGTGKFLFLSRDIAKSAEAIRKFSSKDAERWPAFVARMHRLAGFLDVLYSAPAPDLLASSVRELLPLLKVGRKLRGLGKTDMIELLRTLPMSVSELLDDWFESDVLKGTLGAQGIAHITQGPRSGGTAFVFLHNHVGNDAGAFRGRTRMKGGVQSLSSALVNLAKGLGVQLRTDAAVSRILVRHERAVGIALRSGEEITASTVLSAVDPRRTLCDLVDASEFEPEFLQAVRNIKFRGSVAKVHLALDRLPAFTGLSNDGAELGGVFSVSPSLDYLERAYDHVKYGRVSTAPWLEVMVPSLVDPSFAPAGKHVMSIQVQYVPYRLRGGTWDAARSASLGDAVVALLAQYAPDLPNVVRHREVITPSDLEQKYGLTEGSLNHGELTLDQILFMRPIPGSARYRMPLDGLYLGGSGAHPGGGIAGTPGYLAARQIMADRKRA